MRVLGPAAKNADLEGGVHILGSFARRVPATVWAFLR
jgi:hypothetical protein